METAESFNGVRASGDTGGIIGSGNFIGWFAANGFGGGLYTNYEATPVAVTCWVNEPVQTNVIAGPSLNFGAWASGKPFGICVWGYGLPDSEIQAVGDPFVVR